MDGDEGRYIVDYPRGQISDEFYLTLSLMICEMEHINKFTDDTKLRQVMNISESREIMQMD